MQYISRYSSPIGNVLLAADDVGLTGLWFEGQRHFALYLDKNHEENELPIFKEAKKWLDIYFSGREPEFKLPLHFIGTQFQNEVWEILYSIPYGKTMTYGEIAKILADRRGIKQMSAQAVGGAVGRNEISIIVPCHRVIGADGSLTGYAGGIDKKLALLRLEKIDIEQKRREKMNYTANERRYDAMEYNRLGDSGLKLPAVSLGLWHNFGDNASFENMTEMCKTAFDNGITHFDLANNYGPEAGAAERNFGKILKNGLSAYRDEMIISTKAGYYMWPGPYGDLGSRKYLIASLDQSLKRMELDYVDIFYHHRMDKETPLEETMGALDSIVKSGKALYVGLSNYDGETMKRAAEILKDLKCPFVINQNSYSIINRTIEKNGLLSACGEEKKGLIIFSPLAQGLLTNRYLNGIPSDSRVRTDGRFLKEQSLTEEKLGMIAKLNDMARERGQTLAQMALAWVYRQKAVTSVLVGASKPSQILDNIAMLNNTSFTDEELAMIDKLVQA